mmetsp:Transcript_18809/g.36812  ORF Transcript_18809/g.36812 Transcript_18809/m.36812 type:complete len:247 (-) Transcript_18809:87-827(-)
MLSGIIATVDDRVLNREIRHSYHSPATEVEKNLRWDGDVDVLAFEKTGVRGTPFEFDTGDFVGEELVWLRAPQEKPGLFNLGVVGNLEQNPISYQLFATCQPTELWTVIGLFALRDRLRCLLGCGEESCCPVKHFVAGADKGRISDSFLVLTDPKVVNVIHLLPFLETGQGKRLQVDLFQIGLLQWASLFPFVVTVDVRVKVIAVRIEITVSRQVVDQCAAAVLVPSVHLVGVVICQVRVVISFFR